MYQDGSIEFCIPFKLTPGEVISSGAGGSINVKILLYWLAVKDGMPVSEFAILRCLGCGKTAVAVGGWEPGGKKLVADLGG